MDFSAVSRILEDYRGRGYYPSAVCQIFDEARTLYHRAFGDVTPDTWFDLASVSKIICTTLLLSAMDEGRLSPEDRVLLFSHQRWIGRHSVQHSQVICFSDLIQISRVKKKFHRFYF